MDDLYVDRTLARRLGQAARSLVRGSNELQSGRPASGSVAAAIADEVRRTPGGGGRQRAELIEAVQSRVFTFYSEVGSLLAGLAGLCLTPQHSADAASLARSASVLVRSAYERAAVAHWLISDLRGLVPATWDYETPPGLDYEEFKARNADNLPRNYQEFVERHCAFVDGDEAGRRLLIWALDQLRLQRATWRAAQRDAGQRDWSDGYGERFVRRDDPDKMLDDLDRQEAAMVELAQAASWHAEPQCQVDGSYTPAFLTRRQGSRKERMPTFSELVGPFRYALLSQAAHPSWDPYSMVPSEANLDQAHGVWELHAALVEGWSCLESVQVPAFWAGPRSFSVLMPEPPPDLTPLRRELAEAMS